MQKISTRNKGHSFERRLVKLFKDLGFINCSTSRLTSRALDNVKVDLCATHPFYVQAKAVERLGCLHTILESMPKHEGKYNIVWHKKNRKGSIVAMKEEDFVTILKLLIVHGIIKPEC